jgi:glycogen debranching enzyme
MQIDDRTEWLEADGFGGFASGTTSGIRTRRYHALLLPATTPPTGRIVLVNGVDVWLDTKGGSFALSSQRYAPGVVHPDGACRIVSFSRDPWPTWEFEADDGTRIRHGIVVPYCSGSTVLSWDVIRTAGPVTLRVRPFLSGRDYHSMHHENGAFQFEPIPSNGSLEGDRRSGIVSFAPYSGVPHEWRVSSFARLVSKLSLRGGTRPRPRRHRRPGNTGRIRVAAIGTGRRSRLCLARY